MDSKKTSRIFVFLLTLFTALNAWSANITTNGQPTRGQTMQAFTAVADDPSAIFYNPAGIAQLSGTRIDNSFLILFPDLKYTNRINGVATHSTFKSVGGNLFITSDQIKQIRPFVVGIGVFAPYARRPRYDRNAATFFLKQNGDILRMDIVPTIAVKVTDYLYLGASFVISYAKARSDILGLKERATGYGFTGQLGMLVVLPQNVKIGVTYRGRERAKLRGKGKLPGITDHFRMNLRFPDVLSVGMSWHVFQALILSAALDYEFWSYVQRVRRNYSNPAFLPVANNQVDGTNSPVYRIGALYRATEHHEFRGGFSYDPAAIPSKNIVPAKPDYNAYIGSIGYSYYRGHFRGDIGYEFEYMPNRKSSSVTFPGNYRMYVHIFMIGFGYTFA